MCYPVQVGCADRHDEGLTPKHPDFDRREVGAIKAKETATITIKQTLITSIKIEKSTETKEHGDVEVIIVLVPRG